MTSSHLSLFIPSITSSIFEVCATQPLDVIKTHYQTNTKVIYTFKNLYSGFLPRALGNIPSRSIFLFSQDFLNSYLHNNKYKFMFVPIGASFAQTLFDTPVEVLKINKIMNIKNKFLYKGFIPHYTRNTIFLISVYNMRQYSRNNNHTIFYNSLYGALGGVIGSYISHPFDTIKTRIQSNIPIKNLAIKDYFKGVHIRASMSMINMFISLYVFEMIKILNIF